MSSSSGGADCERRSAGIRFVGLLAAVALVLLFRLGEAPVDVTAEHRVDVVVRTMVASGDWLLPRMGDELRLNKPPLAYWLSAGLAELGLGPTTLALRLPSALAALTLLLVVFAWGQRLGGPRLGLLAAGLLATMESFLALGRRGVAEMLLAASCTAAFALWPELVERRRRSLLPLFALSVGIACLAKATAALFVLGLPIAIDLTRRGLWREALHWRNARWLGAALVLGFAWYGLAFASGGEAREQIANYALLPLGLGDGAVERGAKHYRPIYYFFGVLPQAASPAILLGALFLARSARPRRRELDAERSWPWIVLLSIFVGFSLLPQKQKHYLLPLLPALSLVLAQAALRLGGAQEEVGRRWLRGMAVLALLAGTAALVVFGATYGILLPAGLVPALLLVGLGAALVTGAVRAAWCGEGARFAHLGVLMVLGFWLVWESGIELRLRQWKAGELRAPAWRMAIERASTWVDLPREGSDPREEIPSALLELEAGRR